MMSQNIYKPESAGATPMVPTCCRCGGRKVWINTSGVVWSKKNQRWYINNLDDPYIFCEECDEIESFVWVPLVGPTPGRRLIDVT